MENRKTIRKWFWVWDFEKEEDWLNEMAMNGWVCKFDEFYRQKAAASFSVAFRICVMSART